MQPIRRKAQRSRHTESKTREHSAAWVVFFTHLGKPVDLEIKQTNLRLRVTRVHNRACFGAGVDNKPDSRTGRKDSVRPQHILRSQALNSRDLHHRDIVVQECRRRVDSERPYEGVDILDGSVGWGWLSSTIVSEGMLRGLP